jgi:hypothetical protein
MCAQHLNINLDERVKYIMMDACDAEYNACKKVFPRVHILMYWFHVMKNVKEHFKSDSVPAELEKMVKNDIEELHTCLSFDQFSYKLNNVHLKWSTYPSLNKFKDYFLKNGVIIIMNGPGLVVGSYFKHQLVSQLLIILLNHLIKQLKRVYYV